MFHGPGIENSPLLIGISGTNFGPGATTVSSISIQNKSIWKRILKKDKYAVVIHDYTSKIPHNDNIPKKIEVGEQINLFLPYDEDCFLQEEWTHVGLFDNYGKYHRVKRSQIRGMRKKWLEDFGNKRLAASS
jgi:hypothetical protein